MPKQDAPACDWCFTFNNPKPKHFDAIWDWDYKYLVVSIEQGAETGTVHLQGFVQFQEKLRFTALRKFFKGKISWRKRKGTPYEASHYCKKPVEDCECKHCKEERLNPTHLDGPFEDGTLSVESAYKTAEIARVIAAKGYHHAAQRFPEAVLTMGRGMKLLDHEYTPKRDYKTQVTVLYGKSGTGKTRYATEAFPQTYVLPCHGEGTDFFGDYDPRHHETVVADDFYGNWKFTTFLRVADRYQTEVHTKGDFLQFLAHHLVFTSNSPPDKWYKNVLQDPDRVQSFWRRIENIIRFEEPFGTYVVEKGKSTTN